jgi:hypothetical protein
LSVLDDGNLNIHASFFLFKVAKRFGMRTIGLAENLGPYSTHVIY